METIYIQIVNLNNSVGSTERCQGGFISPAIDDDSTGTDLEMSPELTSVDILDYTLTNHINFEVWDELLHRLTELWGSGT